MSFPNISSEFALIKPCTLPKNGENSYVASATLVRTPKLPSPPASAPSVERCQIDRRAARGRSSPRIYAGKAGSLDKQNDPAAGFRILHLNLMFAYKPCGPVQMIWRFSLKRLEPKFGFISAAVERAALQIHGGIAIRDPFQNVT